MCNSAGQLLQWKMDVLNKVIELHSNMAIFCRHLNFFTSEYKDHCHLAMQMKSKKIMNIQPYIICTFWITYFYIKYSKPVAFNQVLLFASSSSAMLCQNVLRIHTDIHIHIHIYQIIWIYLFRVSVSKILI